MTSNAFEQLLASPIVNLTKTFIEQTIDHYFPAFDFYDYPWTRRRKPERKDNLGYGSDSLLSCKISEKLHCHSLLPAQGLGMR